MDSKASCENPHLGLYSLRDKLGDVLKSVSSFNPSVARPPIIDSSFDLTGNPAETTHRQETVKGLRALKDSVKRDLDVLEKFLADPRHPHLPALSTNAPYLISVWNEVLLAPPPVYAIWSTYSENGKALHPRRRGLPKEAGVKVDVVADGGKRWIRVNTTKNSRMLAEFREIDSYMTDSDDDSDGPTKDRPSLAQTEFDNSVLRMGRSLLATARENPIPGTSEIPTVTLRLTRLDPAPANTKEYDPRIAQTVDQLIAMGVDVQLGERTDAALAQRLHEVPPPTAQLCPTAHINLDLSILIALVSDLAHTALPTSVQGAEERFTPSLEYVEWKKKRIAALRNGASLKPDEEFAHEDDDELIIRPSRALVSQVLQEMGKGLFQDIFDRLSLAKITDMSPLPVIHPSVEFWTTPEARERCLQIVEKIGGPREKERAEALFSKTDLGEAEQEFWRGSRYPFGFVPLFPIRIFPPGEPRDDVHPPSHADNGRPLSPFLHALAETCRSILAQETMPHPRAMPPTVDDGENLGEIQRAIVTKANPRLTAHTVQSMLWGAVRGWTTLTANKTSVKAILREMRAARGGALWDRRDEIDLQRHRESIAGASESTSLRSEYDEVAAIWMVDPRSLAEGMRADYGT